MARWDHAIDDNNRIYTIVHVPGRGRVPQPAPAFRDPPPAATSNSARTNFNAIADWTRILSPTAIFDLRASFGRFMAELPVRRHRRRSHHRNAGDDGYDRRPPPARPTSPRASPSTSSRTCSATTPTCTTFKAENQWNVVPSVDVDQRQEDASIRRGPGLRHDGGGRHRPGRTASCSSRAGAPSGIRSAPRSTRRTDPASPTFCSESRAPARSIGTTRSTAPGPTSASSSRTTGRCGAT